MTVRRRAAVMSRSTELQFEPVGARVRATLDGAAVVDTLDAFLVWEPRRLLSVYAVPESQLQAELEPAEALSQEPPSGNHLLPHETPFEVHTTGGESLDLVSGHARLPGVAFRAQDPRLDGRVLLDFAAFDSWLVEDEVNIAHPRDPFHRIDVYPSSRLVRVEHEGRLIAETKRASVLLEAMLPPRFYIPAADVTVELRHSPTSTVCPYKGEAAYWSAQVGSESIVDAAWSYPKPLPGMESIEGLVCFDDALVTVTAGRT